MIALRRIYLVLFLSLILPVQSLAGMLAAGEICPMDHDTHQQMDCCDEMSMPAGNQPCPDMLKCSTATLPLLDSQRLLLKPLVNARGPLWLAHAVPPSRPQSAPWRPPRV
jgi:hypothetical protein